MRGFARFAAIVLLVAALAPQVFVHTAVSQGSGGQYAREVRFIPLRDWSGLVMVRLGQDYLGSFTGLYVSNTSDCGTVLPTWYRNIGRTVYIVFDPETTLHAGQPASFYVCYGDIEAPSTDLSACTLPGGPCTLNLTAVGGKLTGDSLTIHADMSPETKTYNLTNITGDYSTALTSSPAYVFNATISIDATVDQDYTVTLTDGDVATLASATITVSNGHGEATIQVGSFAHKQVDIHVSAANTSYTANITITLTMYPYTVYTAQVTLPPDTAILVESPRLEGSPEQATATIGDDQGSYVALTLGQPIEELTTQLTLTTQTQLTIAPHLYRWHTNGGYISTSAEQMINAQKYTVIAQGAPLTTNEYRNGIVSTTSFSSSGPYFSMGTAFGRGFYFAIANSTGGSLLAEDQGNIEILYNVEAEKTYAMAVSTYDTYAWVTVLYNSVPVIDKNFTYPSDFGSPVFMPSDASVVLAKGLKWEQPKKWYIDYVLLYDSCKARSDVMNTILSHVVNASGLAVFLDPTFYDGKVYVDLSGNGNDGTPYGDVRRIPAEDGWLWVVRGLGEPGVLHLRFFPNNTVVEFFDNSTGLLVKSFTVTGSSDPVPDYTVTVGTQLPAGNYTVRFLVPFAAAAKKVYTVLRAGDQQVSVDYEGDEALWASQLAVSGDFPEQGVAQTLLDAGPVYGNFSIAVSVGVDYPGDYGLSWSLLKVFVALQEYRDYVIGPAYNPGAVSGQQVVLSNPYAGKEYMMAKAALTGLLLGAALWLFLTGIHRNDLHYAILGYTVMGTDVLVNFAIGDYDVAKVLAAVAIMLIVYPVAERIGDLIAAMMSGRKPRWP